MNIERYVMPVIIAAGFHAALLLHVEDRKPRATDAKPVNPPPVQIDRIEMMPDNSDEADAGDSGGGVDPLPQIPDVVQKLTREDIFEVPVTEPIVSIKPVSNLPRIPEGLVGPGAGPGPGLGNGLRNIIDGTRLDRAPRAVVQPAPPYPNSLRQDGTSGTVTVEFVVDTTGRVITANAVRWTHREFADPAVRAVLRWKFEPGTVDGRKVSFRMAVPIEFNAER